MSDSETDPDLTVERYDLEDDLNAYGSPVCAPSDAVGDQQPGPSNIIADGDRPPDRTVVSVIFSYVALLVVNCQTPSTM